MADNAGIVVHKTTTRNYALTANSEAGLKSTPLAVGSTAVSEHFSSVGVEVNNLRSWITRDVLNFEKCEADTTLQELGLKGAEQAEQGTHVLYIIVFRKLILITTLSGEEFLAAWWKIVKCHRALWKGGVFHRDVRPNNQMVYRLRGQFIGVLNGYDLLSLKRDSPSGLERTGTVPFMALNLLTPEIITGRTRVRP